MLASRHLRNVKGEDLRTDTLQPALDRAPLHLTGACEYVRGSRSSAASHRPSLSALTIVHTTFADPEELTSHADMLKLSAASWLLTGTLMLAFNGGDLENATSNQALHAAARRYPQKEVVVCTLPNNGYRCGQFADWHRLSAAWNGGQYDAVLYIESDVYLTPAAIRIVESAVSKATTQARWWAANFRDYRTMFNMDFFVMTTSSNMPSAALMVWYRAYRLCANTTYGDPIRGPESMFFRAATSSGLPHTVLLNSTFHGNRRIDAMGVWHTHEPSRVNEWLHMNATQHQNPVRHER